MLHSGDAREIGHSAFLWFIFSCCDLLLKSAFHWSLAFTHETLLFLTAGIFHITILHFIKISPRILKDQWNKINKHFWIPKIHGSVRFSLVFWVKFQVKQDCCWNIQVKFCLLCRASTKLSATFFPPRLKAAWRRLQWPIVEQLSSSPDQWETTRSACQSQVRVDGKKVGWKEPETGGSPGWWQSYTEEQHRACGCSRNFPRLLPRGCDQDPTLEGKTFSHSRAPRRE